MPEYGLVVARNWSDAFSMIWITTTCPIIFFIIFFPFLELHQIIETIQMYIFCVFIGIGCAFLGVYLSWSEERAIKKQMENSQGEE